jgi:hypothetical protein
MPMPTPAPPLPPRVPCIDVPVSVGLISEVKKPGASPAVGPTAANDEPRGTKPAVVVEVDRVLGLWLWLTAADADGPP